MFEKQKSSEGFNQTLLSLFTNESIVTNSLFNILMSNKE